MVHVFPFRGYRYNTEQVGVLGNVIADPYDKIDDELQEMYYEKHPRNIVRIIKGKTYPHDDQKDNQYTRAAGFLESWIGEGVLRRDETPSIYIYDQEYVVPGLGETKTRRGFVALCRLMSYEEGGVKPHERTLAGPKADRLNLMRATKAQFGQIFVLYPDPDQDVAKLLDRWRSANPPVVGKDRFSDSHKVWPIGDPETIKSLQQIMLSKQLFIADGHHRYETALAYRDEMRGKVKPTSDTETIENRMLTFVSFEDPGLLVLPTHRLVKNVKGFDPARLVESMSEFFTIESFEFTDDRSMKAAQQKMEGLLKSQSESAHVFGLLLAGQKRLMVAKLKDEGIMDRIAQEEPSEGFRRLDVVILHSLILEKLLGITKDDLTHERNVEYVREIPIGISAVMRGDYQAFFMVNPTKTWQVRNVASEGVRMPQKSTDFYPKLVTGMVLNKLSI